MQKRFHLNPRTGDSDVCSASKKSCPYGASFEHYASKELAHLAFELQQKYGGDYYPLFQLLDLDEMARDLQQRYLSLSVHPEDEQLKILSYSKSAQIEGYWSEVTKSCRGLIIRSDKDDFSDAVIIERPWRKFFTLEQVSGGDWVLGDEERDGDSVEAELLRLDLSAPAEVTDKLDGSLGILYRAPDGLPAFSTKGSFVSSVANYYTDLLRSRPEALADANEALNNHSTRSHLFELVGPDNQIVLRYPKDEIILLGSVEKKSGMYISTDSSKGLWRGEVAERMDAKTVEDAFRMPDRPEREGVVIRVLSTDPAKQMLLKVKQDDYKSQHRILANFGKGKIRTIINDGLVNSSFNDLSAAIQSGSIDNFPAVAKLNEIKAKNPLLGERVDDAKKRLLNKLTPVYENIRAAETKVAAIPDEFLKQENPRRAFAEMIKDEDAAKKPYLYTAFRARLENKSMAEVVRIPKSIDIFDTYD